MTRVRCPACSTIVADPARLFRCSSCDRRLRWRRVGVGVPLQLGLFGEADPVTPPARRRRQPPRMPPPPADPARTQPPVRSHQDVLAAATEMFYEDNARMHGAIDRAQALLSHQSEADLRVAVLGGAWMVALALKAIERVNPGVGDEILRAIALDLAEFEG
jgi:hypothetical protein